MNVMADGLSLFDFLHNGCITFALFLLPEQTEAFILADSYILCNGRHLYDQLFPIREITDDKYKKVCKNRISRTVNNSLHIITHSYHCEVDEFLRAKTLILNGGKNWNFEYNQKEDPVVGRNYVHSTLTS